MKIVLPKIQANVSGAADALMLDLEGFVSGAVFYFFQFRINLHNGRNECYKCVYGEAQYCFHTACRLLFARLIKYSVYCSTRNILLDNIFVLGIYSIYCVSSSLKELRVRL